jgi:hypothetical protein
VVRFARVREDQTDIVHPDELLAAASSSLNV